MIVVGVGAAVTAVGAKGATVIVVTVITGTEG